MTVLVNARAAARPELGGVERWARELAVRLPALDASRYAAVRPPTALAHRAGHAWEQVVLPAQARARRAQILLCPANLAPLAFGRNVVVIHDAAALREPSWYSPAYARWQRAILPRIARGALHVVTPSAFSREEVVELLGVGADHVAVIPGGVDGRFRPDADAAGAAAALGLERPYVLAVGSRTARKNLTALDVSAARLASRGIELVVAGGDRPQFRGEPASQDMRFLGPVPEARLPGLYAGAAAFVLPSLHEGFGLTGLEAMASGVPVVAARAGALPEVYEGAARYADPHDPAGLADAVDAALDAPRDAAAGRVQASRFTWERTIGELDELIRGLGA